MANAMSNLVIKQQWNEDDSKNFINYGEYFVPDREFQIKCICDVIPRPSKPCHIIDLGCGEGLLSRALLDRFPDCQVFGLDSSQTMIAYLENALANYGKRFEAIKIDLEAGDWHQFFGPAHAVVSSLAIHHLDDTQKQTLFEQIISLLIRGGSFIIADLIRPGTELGKRFAAESWDEAVRQSSLRLDGDLRAYDYFQQINWNLYSHPDPLDKPSRLFDQFKWLEKAGFDNIDVFWLKAGHAIFGCRKPTR